MQTNKHIGRILKPFKLEYIGEEQIAKVRFGLAIKRFPSKDSKTDFIYYVAYRNVAERLFKYANQKGLPIEIDFTQQSRVYENADGKSVYRVENVVEKFIPWAPLSGQHVNPTKASAPDTVVENDYSPEKFEQQFPDGYSVL